ncbi:MAG: prephenate dehydrogenase [Candidatus Omnitrophota bacterium]|nr:prephenate dehydrogenase [Candidatus Omnitrophota bacterium]
MKKPFNTIGVVGLGLIGSSLAKRVKTGHIAAKVLGLSRKQETIRYAKSHGIIDNGSTDPGILKSCDLVILATPVKTIIHLSENISKIIKPGCIVTDVGSTKLEIVKKLENEFPLFIGSHPLAGSEKRGVGNYNQDIFTGSLCILTPTKKTSKQALIRIADFWKQIGTKISYLSPATHDRILASVSHLPHAISFSLINSVPKKYFKFCAGSFKDTTRIAASDSLLWNDIFLTNRKNLLPAITIFENKLANLKKAILANKHVSLNHILIQAQKKRRSLNDYCY